MLSPAVNARLQALSSTRLLDSDPEMAFDRLTRLAARLLDAPVSLVSLVDEHRQFFKSAHGLAEPWASRRETPLSHSFCQTVTRERARLVVSDAREHPLLRDNLAIRDLNVVAYAGVPLFIDDQAIGAFCVVDDKPRIWRPDQVALLDDLAASVVSEIELRRALQDARRARALTEGIVESMADACIAIDTERTFVTVNRVARELFAEAEAGRAVPPGWAAMHRSHRPDGSPVLSREGPLGRGLDGESTNDLVFSVQKPGAPTATWVEVRGRPVRDTEGQVIGSVATYRDVTEKLQRMDLEAAQRRSDQIYRAIVRHLPNGAVFMVDRDLRYVSADGPILPDVLRRSDVHTLVGRHVTDVVSPVNRDAIVGTYQAALQGVSQNVEIERDGRFFEVSTAPITEGGEVTHALVFSYDVTERRRETLELAKARDSLARERWLLGTMLGHISDGVALLDAERTVLLGNQAFANMLGVSLERVQGMPREQFFELILPLLEDPSAFAADFPMVAPRPTSQDFAFARPRHRTFRRRWTPLRLGDDDGILVTWSDITAERDLLRERERQLLVDALTGIPNRRAAEVAMHTEQERMKRLGSPLCVALFDVDHFKQVNDRHGHAVGDEVLRVIAGALAGAARVTDTVARWGGEEFVAILNVSLDGARVFCERVRSIVADLRSPPVERMTISAGVAEVAPGEAPMDALARADARLYQAKGAGRNRVASG